MRGMVPRPRYGLHRAPPRLGSPILPIGRTVMGQSHYAAGCLCGAVRLETSMEPRRVGICHCLDCRKHHGAVFHTFAIFPTEAVTITGKTADYGERHFCPTCGSSVFARTGDEIEIAAGSFDAPSQV